jgi:predicted nuclease with TOPRIM domain
MKMKPMDARLGQLLVEFVEKTALLRRDLQHQGELEKYAARFARMEQKLASLTERVEETDPALAKALRQAWARPAISLAYRNAEHQKDPE